MLTNRHGFSFAVPIIAFGVVLTLGGLASLVSSPLIGGILALVGPFFWSSYHGTQIDPAKKRVREFESYYGMMRGEWKPLEKFPFVSVLKGREGMANHSRYHKSTQYVADYFEVCLLSQTHRTRIVVKKIKNIADADKYAALLAGQLNQEVTIFSPQISEATRNRRMRR